MKTYHGYRPAERGNDDEAISGECIVTVSSGSRRRPLRARQDIRNHSPTGFEWGYGGSGPAQLALALVADCMGRKYARPGIYQRVKKTIVSKLPHDGWTLTETSLKAAILDAEAVEAEHFNRSNS
jgi:hypothetical protein